MYRIIQEALNNTAKHSEASRLSIHCAKDRSSLTIRIKDNGKGFDQHDHAVNAPENSGMGLLNMKERAAFIGGTVSIRSSPRKGMEIKVQLPF
jgi:signal transduction histidine kinase